MIPDVSHLSDDGVWDVCRRPGSPLWPVIPAAGRCTPTRRNLTDAMLRALADRGCLVGVNFYAGFLGPHGTSRLADLTRHIRHMIQVGGPGPGGAGLGL